MIRRRLIEQHHCALCAGLFPPTERVWWSRPASLSGPLMTSNQIRINTLALAARLPTVSIVRESAEAGALMSYGAHFPSLFQRAADYVDKILRGAKPADLPVEQPTNFQLIINLNTAKRLRLTIPGDVLARADKVIR